MTKTFRDVGRKGANLNLPLEGEGRWNPSRKRGVRERNSGLQMRKLGEDERMQAWKTPEPAIHSPIMTKEHLELSAWGGVWGK